jgi:hypothetical protein
MEAPSLSTLQVRLTASLKGESCIKHTNLKIKHLKVKTFFGVVNNQYG